MNTSPPPVRRGSKLIALDEPLKVLSAPPLHRLGKPKALPEGRPQAPRSGVSELRTRVVLASILMLGTFMIGIFGYKAIDPQSSWVDAVYMTANAITTAGFREAVDVSGRTGK